MVEEIIDIPLPGQIISCLGVAKTASQVSGAEQHFLAGPENRLVNVVVRSVLDEKPNGYNPIVLYGPSGTGKSHLALAMAAEWKARNRRQRVECTQAVDFARELAEAIETQALEEFRTKYRQAGMVVFEDIGRLVNRKTEKLSAQGELVHTLDALVDRGAWVLITSATSPSEMTGIVPTLQSRLTGGLTVPLVPPEPDTRLAILNQLAATRNIDLPDAVARSLAEGFCGTVPELTGALMQLEVPARRDGCRINIKAVQSLLTRHNRETKSDIHEIALATAKHYGLKLSELRSPSRERAVVTGRDVAIYLIRNIIRCSFERIGQYFGGRDHTTIMHSWKKMESLLNGDPVMCREVEKLRETILKNAGK